MKRYINMRGSNGVETIDEFDSQELNLNRIEFRIYVREMLAEYRLGDTSNYYYISQRCTNEWKQK